MMASVKNTKKGPPDLEVARHVLANEAAAIRDLAKKIDFSFKFPGKEINTRS